MVWTREFQKDMLKFDVIIFIFTVILRTEGQSCQQGLNALFFTLSASSSGPDLEI